MSIRQSSLAALAALALLGLGAQSAPATLPIGEQFRVSQMGPDGDADFGGFSPAVAHNALANEYLVVWGGEDSTEGESEIFGRFYTGVGMPLGTEFRVSDMGPDGDPDYAGFDAAVAYSSQANEYLVVWAGDDNTPPLVDEQREIFGQRLSATGTELGTNDFRISDIGPDGNPSFAGDPGVAYNPQANEYLVTWLGNAETGPPVDSSNEVFGQRLSAAGTEEGADDFRISDMGPDEDMDFNADDPTVAYGSGPNEYLVTWHGDDDVAPLVADETEIFGQRLSAAGTEQGTNDFRISNTGPDENTGFAATVAAAAYNPQANEYLVAWRADDDTPPLINQEFEIFGQRLSAAGAEQGPNDFRISDMGPDGNTGFNVNNTIVAYGSRTNEYLVAWGGNDTTTDFEIFGQRLDAAGAEQGANDFRISVMGPDGDMNFSGTDPGVAYSPQANEYLVAWEGDDDTDPLVDNEFEIFARRSGAGPLPQGPGVPGPGTPGPGAGRATPDVEGDASGRRRRGRYRIVVTGSVEPPAGTAGSGGRVAQAPDCSGTVAIDVKGPRNRRLILRRTQLRPNCTFRRVLRFSRARVRKRIGRRRERRLRRVRIITRFQGNATLAPARDRFRVRVRR